MKKTEVKINIDEGIEKWNDMNPEKRRLTRNYFYEKIGISPMTIYNWKNGKVPTAFLQLFSFLEITGLELSDILSAKNEEGKKIY